MKKAFLFILFVFGNGIIIIVAFAQSPFITPTHEYILQFNEDFNGNAVDFSKWTYPENGQFHSRVQSGIDDNCNNRDQQYFTTTGDNLFVSNSIGSIIAKREYLGFKRSIDYLADNYMLGSCENLMEFFFSSAEIWTKEGFGYGVYEAKVKFAEGSGYGGAFWMFSDEGYEIDVNEYNGNEPWVIHTDYHCFDNGNDQCGNPHPYEVSGYLPTSLSDAYHIHTLIWTSQHIEWLIDGVPFRVEFISLPEAHMHIILTLGIGGKGNSGYPSFNSTTFPIQMDVDYVRFWKIGQKFPDCTTGSQDDITISNTNFSGSDVKHIKNSIAVNNVKIESGANVLWTAKSIDLTNFKTEIGANVVIEAIDCIELFGRLASQDTTGSGKGKTKGNKTDTTQIAGNSPKGRISPSADAQPSVNEETKNKSAVDSRQSAIVSGKSGESATQSSNQATKQSPISITPNPSADGKFNLYCAMQEVGCMEAEISVMNALGQTISKEPMNHYSFPVSIDLSSQPKGTYFVKIQNAERVFVEKVVSQ